MNYVNPMYSQKNKKDFLLYKNGESLFNSAHSMTLNYKNKKRDYSVYGFDEFVEKTVSDHIRNPKQSKKVNNKNNRNLKGLHELIMDVIDEFDEDELKIKLMGNIIVYGNDENGICTVHNARNIEKRLFNELMESMNGNDEIEININCLSENNIDFFYGSYLTQFPQFSYHWITKKDYIKTTNIESLCNEKWNITKIVSDKFNDLINNDFYESIFDSLCQEPLSWGPVL